MTTRLPIYERMADHDMDLPRHLRGLGEFYAPARRINLDQPISIPEWMVSSRGEPTGVAGQIRWLWLHGEDNPTSGTNVARIISADADNADSVEIGCNGRRGPRCRIDRTRTGRLTLVLED